VRQALLVVGVCPHAPTRAWKTDSPEVLNALGHRNFCPEASMNFKLVNYLIFLIHLKNLQPQNLGLIGL